MPKLRWEPQTRCSSVSCAPKHLQPRNGQHSGGLTLRQHPFSIKDGNAPSLPKGSSIRPCHLCSTGKCLCSIPSCSFPRGPHTARRAVGTELGKRCSLGPLKWERMRALVRAGEDADDCANSHGKWFDRWDVLSQYNAQETKKDQRMII